MGYTILIAKPEPHTNTLITSIQLWLPKCKNIQCQMIVAANGNNLGPKEWMIPMACLNQNARQAANEDKRNDRENGGYWLEHSEDVGKRTLVIYASDQEARSANLCCSVRATPSPHVTTKHLCKNGMFSIGVTTVRLHAYIAPLQESIVAPLCHQID